MIVLSELIRTFRKSGLLTFIVVVKRVATGASQEARFTCAARPPCSYEWQGVTAILTARTASENSNLKRPVLH